MRRAAVIILLTLLLCIPVSADGGYTEQYKNSGAEQIQNGLDGSTREFLNQNGLNPENENWADNLTVQNVFKHIADFLADGAKAPIACGGLLVAIMLMSSALDGCAGKGAARSAITVCTLSGALAVSGNIWSCVSAACAAVEGAAGFMLGFIPVFISLVAVSGGAVTAAASGAVLLTSAELVSSSAAFLIMPLMGGYLAVSICAGVSPIGGFNIAETLKKLSVWGMGLVMTVFLGVLSIQTAISAASDTVVSKTAKFIVGTAVPVAGAALSEAATTVSASLGLLKTSIGVYGVVALAAVMLPIVLELALWRATLIVCAAVGDILENGKMSALLRAADGMLSVLLGVVGLISTMFIISLAVVISAKAVH